MPEETNPSTTPAILQGATELVKAIPIYQDALQPMMQETGKALSVVGRAVNVAISPIRGLVWGAEKVEEWLATKVSEKLARTPDQEIVSPDLSVAGPLIEALKFNGHKPELSEMYASLLAGAMQKSSEYLAHPTFVEKIRSMTTLDARIFEAIAAPEAVPTVNISRKFGDIPGSIPVAGFFSPVFHSAGLSLGLPDTGILALLQSSIENLEGLGLISAVADGHLTSEENQKIYKDIEDGPVCQAFRTQIASSGSSFEFDRTFVRITQTGKNFRAITSL